MMIGASPTPPPKEADPTPPKETDPQIGQEDFSFKKLGRQALDDICIGRFYACEAMCDIVRMPFSVVSFSHHPSSQTH
jgi:hypothetical protein